MVLQSAATPLVSVVIPAFNRAALLPRAIASVQAQNYANWELIVVDDASTDHTRAVVEGAPVQVRYIRLDENRGVGAARNTGIAAAGGDLIAMLDSDDEYLPEHLQSRVDLILREDLDLVAGGVMVDGSVWTVDFFNPGQLVDLHDCVEGGTFVGRSEVFRALGGFNDAAFGEDTDFWLRAQRFRTRFLKEPRTYILHETPGSLRLQRMQNRGL
jgi:glycosyltransferase involved in cell wall biosynthesis